MKARAALAAAVLLLAGACSWFVPEPEPEPEPIRLLTVINGTATKVATVYLDGLFWQTLHPGEQYEEQIDVGCHTLYAEMGLSYWGPQRFCVGTTEENAGGYQWTLTALSEEAP